MTRGADEKHLQEGGMGMCAAHRSVTLCGRRSCRKAASNPSTRCSNRSGAPG